MTLLDVTNGAETSTPIHPVLAARRSPRAFDGAPIDETKLTALLEAARWSASAANMQPWRFIVGRKGSATFDAIAESLVGFNRDWAPRASVLLVAVAATTLVNGDPHPTALYDLGQSMAHLSVQAHHDGLYVHQMAGFSAADISTAFDLPDDLLPFSVSAIGTLGDITELGEKFTERERAPRTRKPLDEIVIVDD